MNFFGWQNPSMPQQYISTSKSAIKTMANYLQPAGSRECSSTIPVTAHIQPGSSTIPVRAHIQPGSSTSAIHVRANIQPGSLATQPGSTVPVPAPIQPSSVDPAELLNLETHSVSVEKKQARII